MKVRWLSTLLLLVAGLAMAAPWEGFTALAVSPDGRYYATGGRQGEVLWGEVATGEVLGRWHLAGRVPVVAVGFRSPPSALVAATLDGRQAFLTLGSAEVGPGADPSLGDAAGRWKAAAPLLKGVEADLGANRAFGGADGTVSVTNGSQRLVWQAHSAAVTGLAWGPDASFLLSCSIDGTLVLWNPTTGIALGRL